MWRDLPILDVRASFIDTLPRGSLPAHPGRRVISRVNGEKEGLSQVSQIEYSQNVISCFRQCYCDPRKKPREGSTQLSHDIYSAVYLS